MPVQICSGDLFADPAEAWVNAVNCVGVMGAGIAKQFKKRFPAYYLDYYSKCQDGLLRVGTVDYYALSPLTNDAPPPLFIVSFPTMLNPGEATQESELVTGLKSLTAFCDAYSVQHIAMPALGCGIGDFSFERLKVLVEEAFEPQKAYIDVSLYQPFDIRTLDPTA